MATLRRIAFINSSTHLHPLPFHRNPNSSLQSYIPKSINLKHLTISNQNPSKFINCSISTNSSSMETAPEGYRRNVGICLINRSNKILSASRLDIPSAWQMPQGGVDESEDPATAAMRELKEETGVTSAEILAEAPYWLTYDFPPAVREKLNKQWGTNWKGQAQKWFLLRFTGSDEEINLLGDGSEKPEFGEWQWMTPEQAIASAVNFKKPVYEEVFRVFAPHLQSDLAGSL